MSMMTVEPPEDARVLLRDGESAVLRAAVPEDREALERLHERMSPDSLRHRFFASGKELAHQYLDHLAASSDVIAVVAVVDDHVVGLGTAEPFGPGSAEIAFVVDESRHGLGLGTLLLSELAASARARGIARLVAEVMCENHEMLDVLANAGYRASTSRTVDTVQVVLDT